jgi:hypothetical protein
MASVTIQYVEDDPQGLTYKTYNEAGELFSETNTLQLAVQNAKTVYGEDVTIDTQGPAGGLNPPQAAPVESAPAPEPAAPAAPEAPTA